MALLFSQEASAWHTAIDIQSSERPPYPDDLRLDLKSGDA
jgi:hypothetical protein